MVSYQKPALGALAPIVVAFHMHGVVWHTVRDSFEWNVYSEVTSGLARVFFRERNLIKLGKDSDAGTVSQLPVCYLQRPGFAPVRAVYPARVLFLVDGMDLIQMAQT